MPRNQRDFTYDNATLLKAAGAVTADGAAPIVLNLGDGLMDARVIVDVSSITTGGAAGETYAISAQFSDSATFASGVVGGATIRLGAAAGLPGESAASIAGRYELAISNQINGTVYSYMRLYTDVAGTAPSINFTAYLVTR